MLQGDAMYEDDNDRSAEVTVPFNSNSPNTPDQAAINTSINAVSRKFLETISPVPSTAISTSPNGNLAPLYNSTGIYAQFDNHETLDTALESGGAPYNSINYVGGTRPFYREGVDLTANNLVNTSGKFLNQRPEFKALIKTWHDNVPERERGTIKDRKDPRANDSRRLYYDQKWGNNLLFFNADSRSYRDAKITTLKSRLDNGGTRYFENDVTDNSIDQDAARNRTILGDKQMTALKK